MSYLIRFGKRHKKKLIFTAVLFGGGYATVKYSIHRFKKTLLLSSQEANLANQQYERSRKLQHYITIKQTSDEAILGLIKSIEDQINITLTTEDYLDQLKQKAPNKLELWEKIKILSISKCLAKIYAVSILSILVKIELNIIGGYLFKSNSIECSFLDFENGLNKAEEKLTPNVQKRFLENIETFVKEGVAKLCNKIRECVESIFENINLKKNIDIEYLNEKLESVCDVFEEDFDNQFNFLTEYLNLNFKEKPDELSASLLVEKSKSNSLNEEEILRNLNNETLDLILCDDFKLIFHSIFDSIKNDFLNNLSSLMLKQIIDKESSDRINISLPFAKIVPILNQMNISYDQNILINNLKLNIFSANIYEAFSYVPLNESNSDPLAGLDVNMLLKNFL